MAQPIFHHVNRIGLLGLAMLSFVGSVSCSRRATYYLDRGNKLYEMRKYEDAALSYRKAIQKDARLGQAQYQLGLAELKQNHQREAFEALYAAVRLLPDNPDAKVKLADLCLLAYSQDPRRPKALYDRVSGLAEDLSKKDPNSYDSLRLRGYLAYSDRKPAQAEEFFRKANEMRPMQPEVVLSLTQILIVENKTAEAETLAKALIQRENGFGPIYDTLYELYQASGRAAEAEGMLTLKIANNPKDSQSRLQLALHYFQAKKPVEMLGVLQQLLDNPKYFPQAWMQVGDFYRGIQNWDEARRQYERGLAAEPKEKLTYQKRLLALAVSQGNKQECTRLVDTVLREDPEDKEALQVRAGLLMETGRPADLDRSIASLKALIEKNPSDAVLRYDLGVAHMGKGETEDAARSFQEAAAKSATYITPRLVLANLTLGKGRFAESYRYANEAVAIDPRNKGARVLRAAALRALGKPKEARADLEGVLADDPQFVDASNQLGLLDVSEKRFKEGEAIFLKLYQPGQADVRPVLGLAAAYNAQNEFAKTMQLFDEELRKTSNLDVRAAFARTAALAGDYNLAIEEYESVIVSRPDSAALYAQMGDVYRQKGNLERAIVCLRKATSLAPNDIGAVTSLATLLELKGRSAEANAQYRQVLRIDPKNATALNNLAYLLADTGDSLDEALKMVQLALQMKPDDIRASDTLGYIYLKKNWTDSAMQIFNKLVKQNPHEGAYHYHLALALLGKGERQQAKSELQAALKNKATADVQTKARDLLMKLS